MSDFRRFCIGVTLALAVMCLIARAVGAHGVLPLEELARFACIAVTVGIVSVAVLGKPSA